MTMTPQEIDAQNKAVAASFNQQNPAGGSAEENAARAAAAAINSNQGSVDHNGAGAVRADTAEDTAAKEAAAAAKVIADAQAVEDAKTPEEKAAEVAAATALKATEAAEAKADTSVEWVQTDNKQFNAAIAMMKASGMTAAEGDLIFRDAIATGDLSKVDRALLLDKVGENSADLITAGFTNYLETTGQADLQRTKSIHDAVGGSKNWSDMVKWARGKAKGDEAFSKQVTEITGMMNGDSELSAKLAGKELLAMFNADAGNSTLTTTTTPTTTVAVHGVATTPTATPVAGLTAREYSEGVQKAQKMRSPAEREASMKALSAGRAKGRTLGY